VSDNSERRKRAERMMAFEALERPGAVSAHGDALQAELQGFALIEAYHGPDPSGTWSSTPARRVPHDDPRRLPLARRRVASRSGKVARGGSECRRNDGEPQRIEREAQAKEYLANDGRDQYRRIVRGRVQFGHGGMTGGSNALIHLP
jgi:hypothetical protein